MMREREIMLHDLEAGQVILDTMENRIINFGEEEPCSDSNACDDSSDISSDDFDDETQPESESPVEKVSNKVLKSRRQRECRCRLRYTSSSEGDDEDDTPKGRHSRRKGQPKKKLMRYNK